MRVKELILENFKRFTSLTITDIPEDAKLVLLIGANGSGKSSVFDAFEVFIKNSKGEFFANETDNPYFIKGAVKQADLLIKSWDLGDIITILAKQHARPLSIPDHEPKWKGTSNSFYGRTSFRQTPRLTRDTTGSNKFDIQIDSDRPRYFIDRDDRFENDIEKIAETILKELFRSRNSSEEIRAKYINPINKALDNIFGNINGNNLSLIEIIPPLEGKIAQITFKKGQSEIHYNLLSAGEKEVINILFNLLIRRENFTDTLYFFDEMDLHLNTKIQYNLLKELTENWIPEKSQLWTASHSLGFIDYAKDYEHGAIIDFDSLDFDKPQTLKPIPKNRYDIYEIAVSKDFINKTVQNQTIVFTENKDTPHYNDLGLENTLFFTATDKLGAYWSARNMGTLCLVDRDYLSDEEIADIKGTYPFVKILPYYSIENLLYHPDNLEEYYGQHQQKFNKEAYKNRILKIKQELIPDISLGIKGARDGYPFFKGPDNTEQRKLRPFRENPTAVLALLKSDEFEDFYKVFAAKNYGTHLPERQNLNASELAKTNWFKETITKTLQ